MEGLSASGQKKAVVPPWRRTVRAVLACALLALGIEQAWRHGHDYFLPEKFAVVEPGKIYRGAWQHDWPMQSIIRRYGIKTIVALAHRPGTAMPVREESLARQAGVRWLHVPITDDRSELEGESLFDRLDEAADALADPANQPVYFHCHHGINRASMVQIAFRLKHSGWSLEKATAEIAQNFGLREVDRGPDYRLMSQYFAQRIAPARAKTAASGPPPERHQHASLASP